MYICVYIYIYINMYLDFIPRDYACRVFAGKFERQDLAGVPHTTPIPAWRCEKKRGPLAGLPVVPKQGFWKQGFSESWKCALGSCKTFV